VFFPPLKNHPVAKGLLFVTFFLLFSISYWLVRSLLDDENTYDFPASSFLDTVEITVYLTAIHPVVGFYFLIKKNWWAAVTFLISTSVSIWIIIIAGSFIT